VYIAKLARLTFLGGSAPWRGPAIAVALTGGAALSRAAVEPIGPGIVPFSTFYVSTMLAALLGGAGPGVLALLLGGAAGCLLFMPPGSLDPLAEFVANMALFAVTQAAVVALAVMLRNAVRRAATAEAALQAKVAELEAVVDLVPAGIWFARGPTVSGVSRNHFAAEMLRAPDEPEEERGMMPGLVTRGHVVLRQDGQPVPSDRMPLNRALRGEEAHHVEYEVSFADGETINLLFNFRPIRDRFGRVAGAVAAALDVTALKRSEAALREAIAARELLQREADHRIKNSLQLVTSVLRVQRRRVRDPQAIALLDDALGRVGAVAEAHAALQRSPDLRMADAGQMLEDLAGFVGRLDPKSTIRCERIGDTRLDIERAVPLGLLVVELLTNALRHAFPGLAGGEVELRVAGTPDGGLEVTVRDGGIGTPEVGRPGGLGRDLVRAMAAKIGADVTTRSTLGQGTTVVLQIPRVTEEAVLEAV